MNAGFIYFLLAIAIRMIDGTEYRVNILELFCQNDKYGMLEQWGFCVPSCGYGQSGYGFFDLYMIGNTQVKYKSMHENAFFHCLL